MKRTRLTSISGGIGGKGWLERKEGLLEEGNLSCSANEKREVLEKLSQERADSKSLIAGGWGGGVDLARSKVKSISVSMYFTDIYNCAISCGCGM